MPNLMISSTNPQVSSVVVMDGLLTGVIIGQMYVKS